MAKKKRKAGNDISHLKDGIKDLGALDKHLGTVQSNLETFLDQVVLKSGVESLKKGGKNTLKPRPRRRR